MCEQFFGHYRKHSFIIDSSQKRVKLQSSIILRNQASFKRCRQFDSCHNNFDIYDSDKIQI